MQSTRYDRRTQAASYGGLTRVVEGPAAWLFTFVVFPLLLVAALLLPPVNLLERLEAFTYTRISAAGGALRDSDGTLVSFPSEGVDAAFFAALKSVPRIDFQASQPGQELYEAVRTMPTTMLPRSPIYQVKVRGSEPSLSNVRIPIPNDSKPYNTLSVYNWNGGGWEYIPSRVLEAEDVIEATVEGIAANFVVVQTSSAVPAATIDLGMNKTPPVNAVVTYKAMAGLYLRGDGALDGQAPTNEGGNTLPVIRNWEGSGLDPKVVRTDLLFNMLSDPGMIDNQVIAVRETVVQNGYPGVVIDYRGVDPQPSVMADYVHMISKLADELHKNGKTLAVRVEAPSPASADLWDTGGYDWRGLGKSVDTLIVPAPIDPRAFQPGADMDTMMAWAVSQVDRAKLQIEFNGQSVERSGSYLLLKGYTEALQPLVQKVKLEASGSQVAVSLDNPTLLDAVTWDETIGMYTYRFIDGQGLERNVFVENEGSFKHKLSMLQKYNVRNVNLQVPPSGDIDPNLWRVVLDFQQGAKIQGEKTPITVAYSVFGADGQPVGSANATLENSRALVNASASGEMKVEAKLSDARGGVIPLSVASVAKAVRVAVATVSNTAIAAAATSTDSQTVAAAATTTERPRLSSGQLVNVREGPGTNYATLGQIQPGGNFDIVGKSPAGDWWQIALPNGRNGWVIGQLVSTAGDVNAVTIAQDIQTAPQAVAAAPVAPAPADPQPAAPAPVAPAPADPAPVAAPVVSAPAPSGGIPFGYGIQAHVVDTSDGMISQVMGSARGMGFGWVKSQIEWKRFEAEAGARDFGPIDPIVNQANGAGINLLFSVVNAPAWAREGGHDASVGGPPADPATYAAFVGALAGKYCGSSLKAIEVWNEQNLHYEWGNKPLNPNEYVSLLAAGYSAIKSACPSMYVVTGALTPAGNNGGLAMDDFDYLRAMLQAGAARYADSIGAHPSGYNVPPSATAETACAAIQASGNSFNGACDSPHHSWSYRSTMEGYRNIAVQFGAGDKTIVATEFGWAAGGAYHPAYAYANDNDFTEQAAWTVEAYQMAKSWGWAGPMILWNLNFRVVADQTEKAQWGIVQNDWTPLPVYNSLAGMAK